MLLLDGVGAGRVGSGSLAIPQAQAAAEAPAGQGKPVALIKFVGADRKGQDVGSSPHTLCGTIVAFSPVGTGVTHVGGPLVGIARWGSGNGSQAICEFDVPVSTGISDPVAGALITVAGDSLELLVRNDGNLRPSTGSDPLNGGVTTPTPSGSASIAIGNRAGSTQITRTVYAMFNPGGAGLASGGLLAIPVPAFARTFRIFRHNEPIVAGTMPPVNVSVGGTFVVEGPFLIAAGVQSPEFQIPGGCFTVICVNPGPGAIEVLGAVFTIGL